jgi:hypothetical protein
VNRRLLRIAQVVLVVCSIPVAGLWIPVGFLPLYLLLAFVTYGDYEITDDDPAESDEDRKVRLGLKQLEDLANGEPTK